MAGPASRASDDPPDRDAARRELRGRLLSKVLAAVGVVVCRMNLRTVRALGGAIGTLAYYVDFPDRRRAAYHLALAFPEWDRSRRRRTTRAMFHHLGVSLFEILWLPRLDQKTLRETTVFEGTEEMLALIDQGRGVVVFTAHCGNWEWLAFATGMLGRPVSVLQRERNESDINDFITAVRARAGIRTIDRGSSVSAREMIHAVRRAGILAFVIDQNIRTESVKVPFFGRPALTPLGPARLAIRTGAVVVTAFIHRGDDGMQYIRFSKPLDPGTDPVDLTARVTAAVEEQIRRVPEQWVWMHKRWRERPEWEKRIEE